MPALAQARSSIGLLPCGHRGRAFSRRSDVGLARWPRMVDRHAAVIAVSRRTPFSIR
jgi:hypothetical protein